jgi:S-adenosylmethionine-diacylgycerolhomoserine-N-methlytransferase
VSQTNHGALMDDVYRHQRYIYDLTRKYYLFGRDRLIRDLDLKPGERLIEVGCGTARNLIAIAQLYPGAILYGLDASQEMLKTAEQAIARAGLSSRIKLIHAYAEALTPALFGEDKPFDRAVFSYSLSMIPDWRQAMRAASQALAPDGRIHVVDFGDLSGMGPVFAGLMRAWLRQFHVEPRVEILRGLESHLAANDHSGNDLRILLGRYAFVFRGTQEGVLRIAN